ncbi:hypothetical protein ZIOFF_037417 [Zingiber officinale]|uniref:DUF1640 domain-containing protein n=1 Tax=Zingiber officinale TaxID=94328 RepID=A0A8J5GJI8_ZINOF|nr:hypothetical protein ZIOFF_037417 [Zingiber officinale]
MYSHHCCSTRLIDRHYHLRLQPLSAANVDDHAAAPTQRSTSIAIRRCNSWLLRISDTRFGIIVCFTTTSVVASSQLPRLLFPPELDHHVWPLFGFTFAAASFLWSSFSPWLVSGGYISISRDSSLMLYFLLFDPNFSYPVRRLEAQGLPPNQAYIIISTLTTFLNTSLDHLAQSVVSKSAINEFMAKQNSDLSQFKLEMKHMQDGHFNSVEIMEVEAGLEAVKFEIMKYCVGTFVSAGSICLAFVLFWK